jgi:hypothetical protein
MSRLIFSTDGEPTPQEVSKFIETVYAQARIYYDEAEVYYEQEGHGDISWIEALGYAFDAEARYAGLGED